MARGQFLPILSGASFVIFSRLLSLPPSLLNFHGICCHFLAPFVTSYGLWSIFIDLVSRFFRLGLHVLLAFLQFFQTNTGRTCEEELVCACARLVRTFPFSLAQPHTIERSLDNSHHHHPGCDGVVTQTCSLTRCLFSRCFACSCARLHRYVPARRTRPGTGPARCHLGRKPKRLEHDEHRRLHP